MARVFISSRFEEFATLRRVLSEVVARTSAVEIVDLDDGKAAAVDAVERSISSLNECDVVVLLCGETYADWDEPAYVEGSVPGQLSTTHREFRAAMDAGVPVLAFRTVSVTRDKRLEAMLAEVCEACVVGALLPDPLDNVDKILDQLEDWASKVDEAAFPDGASSFAGQVMQDLSYLGVEHLDTWTLPDSKVLQQPAYVRLIEQRRFALASLTAGEVDAARGQLGEACTIYSLDWATDYVLARLLEVKNIKQDQSTARDIARKAALGVADQDHAPMTLKNGEWDTAMDRREVATLTLQARLARRALDLDAGAGFAEQALERAPTSREALVERVRVYGLAHEVDKAKEAARELLMIYPDRAVTLMRSEDLVKVQPDVEQALIDFVLERHKAALRALRIQVPKITSPTRLRKAFNLLRGANNDARCDLAEATTAVAALTETDSAGKVVTLVENRAAKLETAEQDAVAAQVALRCATDVLDNLGPTPGLSDWGRADVELPLWATSSLRELRNVTAKRATHRDEITSLFLELRGSETWPPDPIAWVVKEQSEDSVKHRVGSLKLDRLRHPPKHRLWWGYTAVVSSFIMTYASYAAGMNFERKWTVVHWLESQTPTIAGVICALAVLLLLVNPSLPRSARKVGRQERSLEGLDARTRRLASLKDALDSDELLGVRRMALVAELSPRLAGLFDELVSHRGVLVVQFETSNQLVREAKAGLKTALEAHKRTTAMLGLDAAVVFRAVVADLRARYVRYNHAFAVFPNLSSGSYVPQRRVKTGEITRIADGDSVQAQGGFLKLGSDVSRRLVRQVGPGRVSDVRAILDNPPDQIDAFELFLSEYHGDTVGTANIR